MRFPQRGERRRSQPSGANLQIARARNPLIDFLILNTDAILRNPFSRLQVAPRSFPPWPPALPRYRNPFRRSSKRPGGGALPTALLVAGRMARAVEGLGGKAGRGGVHQRPRLPRLLKLGITRTGDIDLRSIDPGT